MRHVERSLATFVVLTIGLLVSASCSTSSDGGGGPPPLFNAVDNSVTCPAGQIGWDFSTGGASGIPTKLPHSLHIGSATLGYPYGAVISDLTSKMTTLCEGQLQCELPYPSTDSRTQVVVNYTCGGGARATTAYPTDKTVHVQCGQAITVEKAMVYCGASPYYLVTDYVSRACSGSDVCPATLNLNAYGVFAAVTNNGYWCQYQPTRDGKLEVQYRCGVDPTVKTVSQPFSISGGNSPLTFACPPASEAAPLPQLVVTEATYGGNCKATNTGNWTNTFQTSCDGNQSCSRVTSQPGDPSDPAPNCSKSLAVTYQCGANTSSLVVVPAEAAGQSVTLECGQQMHIVKASYGANADPKLAGNFTAVATARCDGSMRCQPGADKTKATIATSTALFGSDPAPNKSKQWSFDITCGNDTTVHTQTFGQYDVVDLRCAPRALPTPESWAIHIKSATVPNQAQCCSNCVDLLGPTSSISDACFGKSVCNTKYDPGSDPFYIPGCDATVTWTCGDDRTNRTVRLKAPLAGQDLSAITCAPPIQVLSATYGKNCGTTKGDRTAALATACSGVQETCAYVIDGNALGDPAPGCSKDFDAQFTCGVDPTPQTAHVGNEASGKTLTLNCPTNPYNTKTCVPASCIGNQRRDNSLACVADHTLPVIPAISSWTVGLTPHGATQTIPPQLEKGRPVDLSLAIQLAKNVPDVLVGHDAAKATVWIFDKFTGAKGASPPIVNGVRCVIGHPGLTAGTTQKSVLSSSQPNLLIPPECYPLVNYDGTAGGNLLPSWRDAALRANMDLATFQSKYTMDTQSFLAVSFDENGETLALRTDGTTVNNALVPNPVGFFYDPKRSWVDMISYYQQTQLGAPTNAPTGTKVFPVVLNGTKTIEFRANGATARTAQFDVSPSVALPTIRLDFDWSMYDDPQNPFSPSATYNRNGAVTDTLGAVVEITTEAQYKAHGNQWPGAVDSMVLGNVPPGLVGIPLRNGVPTGKTDQLVVTMSSAVKQRMLTDLSQAYTTGGLGWYDSNNLSKFKVRVCVAASGQDPVTHAFTRSTTWNSVTFNAKASAGTNCVVAPQTLIAIQSDLRVRPSPHTAPNSDAYADSAASADKGNDATTKANNDTGSATGCGDEATVGPSSSTPPDCSKRTTTTSNSAASGGGTGSHSLFSTTASATVDANQQGNVHATAEAAGFHIFDTKDLSGGSEPDFKHSVKISPNWGAIAKVFDESEEENPEPVKPKVEAEKFHAGDQGLGFGVGVTAHLAIGPIPTEVELSESVGVGVSMTLKWDDPEAYPCIGKSSRCFVVFPDAMGQKDADDDCAIRGGQLAEAVTSSDWTGLVGAEPGGSTSEYWIGAQQSFQYTSAACKTTPTAGCAANSMTFYEWKYALDPANSTMPLSFAEQMGITNVALLNPNDGTTLTAPVNFGGPLSALARVKPQVPDEAGIALNGNVLDAKPVETKLGYVCSFAPGGAGSQTNHTGVDLSVSAGAGVGVSVCVPSSVIGACISLGINAIEGEIAFGFENTMTVVNDPVTKRMTQVSGRRSRDISWLVTLLHGELTASLNLLFTSINWTIFSYEGTHWGDSIFHKEGEPYLHKYQ